MTNQLDEYLEAEIQRLLAEDAGIAEQGITVQRREHTAGARAARWRAPHRRDEICRQITDALPGRGDHLRHRHHPGPGAHRGGGDLMIRIAAVGDVHMDEDVVGRYRPALEQLPDRPTCCCSPAT